MINNIILEYGDMFKIKCIQPIVFMYLETINNEMLYLYANEIFLYVKYEDGEHYFIYNHYETIEFKASQNNISLFQKI
jgi:hypothetical protein